MNDTICALATAPGGALGIIRISGPQTLEILSHIFTKNLSDSQPNTIHYGHIVEYDATSQHPSTIDEVLVSVFHAPHSYTGEESAEISCHGSRYILNKVLALLIGNGCRQANPGEFTQRAFLNGKMDLSQAEAVADLIASGNKATHQIAMNQLRGHFSSELARLREQLLKLTSLIELELDFSDHEDLEFADRNELLDIANKINNRISSLTHSFETGQALKSGIPVAIIGKTNVGKSTLLNRLLVLWIIDSNPLSEDIQEILEHTNDKSLIIIRNKIDIQTISNINTSLPDKTIINISAKNGTNIDKLEIAIFEAANIPELSEQDVIVTSARQYHSLINAQDNLSRVLSGMESNLPGDIIAEDLRLVLDDLADITGQGRIVTNEVLTNIFTNFCVGK